MSAPNIEMIASSLRRNCSMSSSRDHQIRRRVINDDDDDDSSTDNDGETTVELNSEVALPCYWEQCLDMRTGQVYYINRKDGTRTTKDPRTMSTAHSAVSYYSSDEDDESSDNDTDNDDDEDSGDDTTSYSSGLTSLSSLQDSPSEVTSGSRQTLVAAGCKACFMYFMVPKSVQDCQKCGGELLHLGRNGCSS